ncbi:hypothetical protein ACQPZP_04400 [Spirillospora sp. CA-142024]|uniref:hypothetical protein n=1 Tax=Spirillospora sp. CA-142024 TaxID=3240036 RepID=UPI003D8AB9E4
MLFALPLAVAVQRLYRDETVTGLERDATRTAAVVPDDLAQRPRNGKRQMRAPRPHRKTEERGGPRPTRAQPRKPRQVPGWVLAECRRRFPREFTRQSARIAALRGYFGR